jgi:hypothetical protein
MNQDMKSVKLKKSDKRFGEAYLRAEDPQAHRLPSTIPYLSRKKARVRTILIQVNTSDLHASPPNSQSCVH